MANERASAAIRIIHRLIKTVNQESGLALALSIPDSNSFGGFMTDCDTPMTDSSSEISQNEDNNWPVFPEEFDNFCTLDQKICLLSLRQLSNVSF
jgi:hypothetical protein